MAKDRTGYIYQDKKGKWFARTTYTDGKGSRRNIKRKAKDKTDAKEILKNLLRGLDSEGEKSIEASRLNFNNLADHYSANYLINAEYVDGRKIAGLRDVERAKGFLSHFREFFGNKKLRELTYGDVYNYRSKRLKTNTRYGKPRTLASMNRELAVLRRMFNIALREGWILKNPFNCGEPLISTAGERKRERILTLDEERRLLEACGERNVTYTRNGKTITAIDKGDNRKHLKPFLIALLDTGARKGEILKLVWGDVDLERRIITIKAANTKTLLGRQVGLTQRLFDELAEMWQTSDKNLDTLVFGISDNVRKSFSAACKAAGIKEGGLDGLTLHCLRHTAATRLVKGQLPIQMVGRILGHTQPQTTYRYLSANEETLHQAASIFDSLQMPKFDDVPEISGFVN
ncbi:MAG: tyrosine-type recombinase/integrase [Acidobacteriota bacterium]|nr:tyrosine-type recombinase/integrase [Acidobacteriota bacterium]